MVYISISFVIDVVISIPTVRDSSNIFSIYDFTQLWTWFLCWKLTTTGHLTGRLGHRNDRLLEYLSRLRWIRSLHLFLHSSECCTIACRLFSILVGV
jgi:hypothetical protein